MARSPVVTRRNQAKQEKKDKELELALDKKDQELQKLHLGVRAEWLLGADLWVLRRLVLGTQLGR